MLRVLVNFVREVSVVSDQICTADTTTARQKGDDFDADQGGARFGTVSSKSQKEKGIRVSDSKAAHPNRSDSPAEFPKVTPENIRKAFETGKYPYTEKLSRVEYETTKAQLQAELLKVQLWAQETALGAGDWAKVRSAV